MAPSAKMQAIIKAYIDDPSTRVWINHNDETGVWYYSVQVEGTDFWLDSFDTNQEALKYIRDNGLKMSEDDKK